MCCRLNRLDAEPVQFGAPRSLIALRTGSQPIKPTPASFCSGVGQPTGPYVAGRAGPRHLAIKETEAGPRKFPVKQVFIFTWAGNKNSCLGVFLLTWGLIEQRGR
jgi:hypothetical protein